MTIARPSHGVTSNARDIYRFTRIACVSRLCFARASPNLLGLRVSQHGEQQQTNSSESFISKSHHPARRSLELCQAASITAQASAIKVRFCLQHQVPFGQVLKVIGSCPELGNWQSEHAQELQWSDGHVWTREFSLEPGSYEFKCVIAAGDSVLEWEPGPNRILQVPGGVRAIRVEGAWSRTADGRVVVTEPIAGASVAARQKRAAAARLLVKALAEVNAAAAAAPGPVAARVGRGQAAAGSESGSAEAGTAAEGDGGSGSKRSAAEALEGEALRELVSLDINSEVVAGFGDGDVGEVGGDSEELRVRAAPATAAEAATSAGSVSDVATVSGARKGKVSSLYGNGGLFGASEGEQGANGTAAAEKRAAGGKDRSSGSSSDGAAKSWRALLANSADPDKEQEKEQQRQEQPWLEVVGSAAGEDTAQSSQEETAAVRRDLLAGRHDDSGSEQGTSASDEGRVPDTEQPRFAAVIAAAAKPKAAAEQQQPQQPVPRAANAKAEASVTAAAAAAAEAEKVEAAVAVKVVASEPVLAAAAAVAEAKKKEEVQTRSSVSSVSPAVTAATQAPAGTAALPLSKSEEVQRVVDVAVDAAGKDGVTVESPAPSGGGQSKADSSSSKGRGASWRQLLEDGEAERQSPKAAAPEARQLPEQQQQKPLQKDKAAAEVSEPAVKQAREDKESAKKKEKKKEQEEEEEEGVVSSFARLLVSRLGGQKSAKAKSAKASSAAGAAAGREGKQAPAARKQETSKQKAAKPAKKLEAPVAAATAEVSAPATPPGRDSKALAEPATAATPGNTSSSSSSGSDAAKAAGKATSMGAGSSREAGRRGGGGGVESVSNPTLERLIESWDAAWSRGRAKQAAGETPSASAGSGNSNGGAGLAAATPAVKAGKAANGPLGGSGARPAVAGAGAGGSALPTGRAWQPTGAEASSGSSGAAEKLANGGATGRGVGGGSSGGESLYSIAERLTGGSGPAPAPIGAGSQDSSPGITMRMGAMAAMGVDRQGSYDTRSSYLSQSLLAESGSGVSSEEQPSTALLRQLRAGNGADGAGGSGAAASATTVPNLPATPAPQGILSIADDDENRNMVPPPLPATPVYSSLLSGSLSGFGSAAEDLLRRAADADAVLNMLRGNLPLTPVARGGRGGAAGPLSMVQADQDDDEDEAGSGGRRTRRGRRGVGPRLVPILPIPAASAEAQADPLASARAAAETTRAALQALQQGAAGLGLSPEALAESVARLQDILPKLDALGGQAGDGGAAGAPPPPPSGLPPAVSQFANNLASGLGSVGSGLSDQLRKAAAAAAAVASPASTAMEVPSNGAAANGGNVAATAKGNGVAAAAGTASTAVSSAGSGLLSGLLSGIVGVAGGLTPLPAGSARLVAGAHMIPHVDKVEKGGEDAYFISRVGLGGVAVADGVSGWADEGIDPAEYPRTLMRYASDAYEMARGTMSAPDIIRYAQFRTYLKGSSTVCMALMKPGRKLEVANVGDSGVRILRNGKVIFGTEAQQHAFNMPFQLSHPNNVEDPDSADDADVTLLDVQDGDVIMLATDGLFDNVFDEEVEQIVSQQMRELAAAGRGKVGPATVTVTATAAAVPTAGAGAGEPTPAANGASSGASTSGSGGGGGAGGRGGRGLLSQSFSAAAAAAAAAVAAGGGAAAAAPGAGGSSFRPEDAARVARALAERAHQHARNPTQRTPWSVTSSQQPNFMWAKFFAKGGGKMDDCTVLVAFVCGSD